MWIITAIRLGALFVNVATRIVNVFNIIKNFFLIKNFFKILKIYFKTFCDIKNNINPFGPMGFLEPGLSFYEFSSHFSIFSSKVSIFSLLKFTKLTYKRLFIFYLGPPLRMQDRFCQKKLHANR